MERFSSRILVRILLFVALMNTLLFIATAVLHEAGHALLGVLSGCEGIKIVILELPSQATYTAMQCPQALSGTSVLLSSFILVGPVALLFLSLSGFKEQYMGVILLGGNILGAFLDAAMLTSSVIANYTVVLVGMFIVMLGEDLMVRATLSDKTPTLSERWDMEGAKRSDEREEGEENGDNADETDRFGDNEPDTGGAAPKQS